MAPRSVPVPTLDAVVARLIPAPARRNDTQAELTRKLLGLPDGQGAWPATRWPTLAEVAVASGLTSGRIAQVMGKRRPEWSREPTLQAVHDDLVDALAGLSRVAAASELTDQLLRLTGRPEEPLDTPGGGQLLDLAAGLGDEAVRLAARDPLPTPTTVVRALGVVANRIGLPFTERRLTQLAAAVSGCVLVNARLELYPRDLFNNARLLKPGSHHVVVGNPRTRRHVHGRMSVYAATLSFKEVNVASIVEDEVYRLPLYIPPQAAHIVEVPSATLRNWARGYAYKTLSGVVEAFPMITTARPGSSRGPSVPFLGLAEAYVLAAFRAVGVPMQRIRPAIEWLDRNIGLPAALASERLMTDGAEILFDFSRRSDPATAAAR